MTSETNKRVFGYVRVSTAKQGIRGVSLQEQRAAIHAYAERNGLDVVRWFEERETAAKRGRPVFMEMLRLLRQGEVGGVVIHKIDRSARNLRDWADLGDLIDLGVAVHVAAETLDLRSRGGRLSADIQAVVAADFIRNLREETRKGIYGRLKQGLYPLPAVVGYRNMGGGKPKEVDPLQGPLVFQAYELYDQGEHSLDRLVADMWGRGLRNQAGGRVSRNGMARILSNPFYVGIIRLRSTGETFAGRHVPLVSKRLFDRVQARLQGKAVGRASRHRYLFRRLLKCGECGYSMVGERQKGFIYYRCHTKGCTTKGIREEEISEAVTDLFQRLRFSEEERMCLWHVLQEIEHKEKEHQSEVRRDAELQVARIKEREVRLTDAVIEGLIDRAAYQERKGALLWERKEFEERLSVANGSVAKKLEEILELAARALLSYETGNDEQKRALLRYTTSNREVRGKEVVVEPSNPFRLIASRSDGPLGCPSRDDPRTLSRLVEHIMNEIDVGHVDEAYLQQEPASALGADGSYSNAARGSRRAG